MSGSEEPLGGGACPEPVEDPRLDQLRRERDAQAKEVADLREENERLRRRLERPDTWMAPGHFYSPIPDLEEVRQREETIFDRTSIELPGIDMNLGTQFELFQESVAMYPEADFPRQPSEGHRYHSDNDQFPFCDAFFLWFLMRRLAPKRIVEVGSGYSSAVMMDTNDRHFGGSIDLTFIEPYPTRLLSLVSEEDLRRVRLVREKCQSVPLAVYEELEPGDFLFIDSSHVSKTGSDVNFLLFEVLPALREGVVVHFHDVPFPFEYGREWVYEGRAWNEAYLVRAFLQYNRSFEILLYPSFLGVHEQDYAWEHMPRCMETLGPSLWLRKTAA